jgi:hypothetical protein
MGANGARRLRSTVLPESHPCTRNGVVSGSTQILAQRSQVALSYSSPPRRVQGPGYSKAIQSDGWPVTLPAA